MNSSKASPHQYIVTAIIGGVELNNELISATRGVRYLCCKISILFNMVNRNENGVESYENDYPLERLFHNATARVLDFLILNQQLSYSAEDIGQQTDIPERTLQRVLPLLVEENLLKREREGLAFKYEINLDSERARALIQYARATVRANIRNPKIFPSKNDKKQRRLTDDIKS